ncbi:MAG: peroxiredoxin family protein [Aggregatilineales bacterium]
MALSAAKAGTNTTTGGYKGSQPYLYDVGKPGPGDSAPDLTLESTSGSRVSLSDYKGKTVLLFFQEGVMCDACWTQVSDMEKDAQLFKDQVGVDQLLVVTTDPLNSLAQKVQTGGYKSLVLSDQDKQVSVAYDVLKYGMMDGADPGHTFILVDPTGVIRWRADYGGAPEYAMYVPDAHILQDIKNDQK